MSWNDDRPVFPALPRGMSPVHKRQAPKCIICKERRTYRTIAGHAICSYCEAAGKADKYTKRW